MTLRRTLKRSLSTTTRGLLQFGNSAPSLLLDTYPGAAAAYSLRKLSSSYSGSAIRVRRASDSAEQDIAFSGNDLDTASLTSFCTGTDGFVTTWYDQSGGGNDATQATTTRQPKVYDNAGGVEQENSKPCVVFASASSTNLRATPLGLVNVDQFFVSKVVSFSAYTVNQSAFCISDGLNNPTGSSFFTIYTNDTTSGNGVRCFFNGSQILNENDATRTGQNLFDYLQSSSTNRALYANGGLIISDTSSKTITTASNLYVGANDANQFWSGKIQEIVFYNSDQTSSRTGIDSDIATYYGITLP